MSNFKEKRLCFRLEKDGYGIYSSCNADDIAPFDEHRHPNPTDDGLLMANGFNKWNDNYYYGYTDCKQLLNWWYTENAVRNMQRVRIRLCIYETDDYYVGNTQMTFRKSSARKLGECDPGMIPELAERNIDNEHALTEYVSGLAPYVRTERPTSAQSNCGSRSTLSGRVVRHRPVLRNRPAVCVSDGVVDAVPRPYAIQEYRDNIGFTFAKNLFTKWSDIYGSSRSFGADP